MHLRRQLWLLQVCALQLLTAGSSVIAEHAAAGAASRGRRLLDSGSGAGAGGVGAAPPAGSGPLSFLPTIPSVAAPPPVPAEQTSPLPPPPPPPPPADTTDGAPVPAAESALPSEPPESAPAEPPVDYADIPETNSDYEAQFPAPGAAIVPPPSPPSSPPPPPPPPPSATPQPPEDGVPAPAPPPAAPSAPAPAASGTNGVAQPSGNNNGSTNATDAAPNTATPLFAEDSSRRRLWWIIPAVGVVTVLAMLCTACCVLLQRRKRARAAAAANKQKEHPEGARVPVPSAKAAHSESKPNGSDAGSPVRRPILAARMRAHSAKRTSLNNGRASRTALSPHRNRRARSAAPTLNRLGDHTRAADANSLGALAVRVESSHAATGPAPPAQRQDGPQARMQRVVQQLAEKSPPVLLAGRYVLTHHEAYLDRSSSLWDARDSADATNMYAYTVKFFVDKRGYEAAQKQYADPVLHGCLPELIAHMDGEDQETPGDMACPPFLVLERGVACHEWARQRRDSSDHLQLLLALARLLTSLHATARVHRDLNPKSIIFMPNTTEWRFLHADLIVAGGEPTQPLVTPAYTAPEVLTALEAKEPVLSQPSQDMWSVGVILYGVIADTPPFAPKRETLAAMAAGEAQFPWERQLEGQPAAWQTSALRAIVTRCLARDSAQRPAAPVVAARIAAMARRGAPGQGPSSRAAQPPLPPPLARPADPPVAAAQTAATQPHASARLTVVSAAPRRHTYVQPPPVAPLRLATVRKHHAAESPPPPVAVVSWAEESDDSGSPQARWLPKPTRAIGAHHVAPRHEQPSEPLPPAASVDGSTANSLTGPLQQQDSTTMPAAYSDADTQTLSGTSEASPTTVLAHSTSAAAQSAGVTATTAGTSRDMLTAHRGVDAVPSSLRSEQLTVTLPLVNVQRSEDTRDMSSTADTGTVLLPQRRQRRSDRKFVPSSVTDSEHDTDTRTLPLAQHNARAGPGRHVSPAGASASRELPHRQRSGEATSATAAYAAAPPPPSAELMMPPIMPEVPLFNPSRPPRRRLTHRRGYTPDYGPPTPDSAQPLRTTVQSARGVVLGAVFGALDDWCLRRLLSADARDATVCTLFSAARACSLRPQSKRGRSVERRRGAGSQAMYARRHGDASLMWVFYQAFASGNPALTFHDASLLYRKPELVNLVCVGLLFEGSDEEPHTHLGSLGIVLRDRGREVATYVDPVVGTQQHGGRLAACVLEAFQAWQGPESDGWYRFEMAGRVIRTVEDLPSKGEVYDKWVGLTHVHRAPVGR